MKDSSFKWECFLGGDGCITMYYDMRRESYVINVRAGFMEGTFAIAESEFKKLKSFVRGINA